MLDPFLMGLVMGAAAAFAGFGLRLVQLGSLAVLGLLAWLAAREGTQGLEETVSAFVTVNLIPHARLLAGAAVGIALGSGLLKTLRGH